MVGKKASAVVLGVSSDLACAAASVLMDLRRHAPRLAAEVVVHHDGLRPGDRRRLAALGPVRFERYRLPSRLRRAVDRRTLAQFTGVVFSKFECFRHLAEFRCVTWLDVDQVFQRSLEHLADRCPSGFKIVPSGAAVGEALRRPVEGYDMAAATICASVFVLQDHVGDAAGLYRWCLAEFEKHAPLMLHEQPVFDFLIQRFGLAFEPLPALDYCCHPREAVAPAAAVLHTYCQPKFWNGWENAQWNANYAEWLRMGGTPYRPRRAGLLERAKAKLRRILR